MSLDLSTLPDITHRLTPYILRTLETIHRIYGTTAVTEALCLSLSYHIFYSDRLLSNTTPVFQLQAYEMKFFTDVYRLPSPTPFAADHCATSIPAFREKVNEGTMTDIIEAIRRTTRITFFPPSSEYAFYPPTTPEIQDWLSSQWPEKYPSTHGVAQGWRNTVNQCLTHGQGWNFLTFAPTDGTKNKRHLLFERAFNGSVIVGSGQCKSFNDMKPNKRRGQSPTRPTTTGPAYSQAPSLPVGKLSTPPPQLPSDYSSPTSLDPASSPSSSSDTSMGSLMDLSGPTGYGTLFEPIMMDFTSLLAEPLLAEEPRERSLYDFEANLIRCLGR